MSEPVKLVSVDKSVQTKRQVKPKIEIGWCELIDIPSLGLEKVRAKMDSGAATSSIHATRIKPFMRDGEQWVKFSFHQVVHEKAHYHEARILARRMVRSSNGVAQERYVIEAQLSLGNLSWNGQLTLANRLTMSFPVLVGRRALRRGFLVNSSKRWMLGKPTIGEKL